MDQETRAALNVIKRHLERLIERQEALEALLKEQVEPRTPLELFARELPTITSDTAPEPTPRGSAEWYAWSLAHPICAVCGDTAGVRYIDLEPLGSGYFCPEHVEHATEFLRNLEGAWEE